MSRRTASSCKHLCVQEKPHRCFGYFCAFVPQGLFIASENCDERHKNFKKTAFHSITFSNKNILLRNALLNECFQEQERAKQHVECGTEFA